jgi:hypothetical protein
VYRWLLGVPAVSVLASGGTDTYPARECFDNVMAIYEFSRAERTVRALFQVLTASSANGERCFEHFLGTEASIRISQNPKWTRVYREQHAGDWDQWVRAGLLMKPEGLESKPADGATLVQETRHLEPFSLPVVLDQPPLYYHLKNFFDAVRGAAVLQCPAGEALHSEIMAHKTIEAVVAKKQVAFPS